MYILTVSFSLEGQYKVTCFRKHGNRVFSVIAIYENDVIELAKTLGAEIQLARTFDAGAALRLEDAAERAGIELKAY